RISTCAHLIGDMHRDLIVEPRRRAQAWGSVVRPKSTDLGFFGRAIACRNHPITAEGFDLIISSGVFGAVQGRRRRAAKLRTGLEHKRFHLAPQRAERKRMLADRVLTPDSGSVAGDEVNVNFWLSVSGPVV